MTTKTLFCTAALAAVLVASAPDAQAKPVAFCLTKTGKFVKGDVGTRPLRSCTKSQTPIVLRNSATPGPQGPQGPQGEQGEQVRSKASRVRKASKVRRASKDRRGRMAKMAPPRIPLKMLSSMISRWTSPPCAAAATWSPELPISPFSQLLGTSRRRCGILG